MKRIKFSETLRYKWVTQFRPEKSDLVLINKESHMVDFAVRVIHWMKESKKQEKYLGLARELNKL